MDEEVEKPEHVEADSYAKSEPGENPLARALNVTVSLPEKITVKMVDASVLADYEVWVLISSILASAVVGFLVAYFQSGQSVPYLFMTIVLAILFAISLTMSFVKRHKLQQKSKDVTLHATEVATKEERKLQ